MDENLHVARLSYIFQLLVFHVCRFWKSHSHDSAWLSLVFNSWLFNFMSSQSDLKAWGKQLFWDSKCWYHYNISFSLVYSTVFHLNFNSSWRLWFWFFLSGIVLIFNHFFNQIYVCLLFKVSLRKTCINLNLKYKNPLWFYFSQTLFNFRGLKKFQGNHKLKIKTKRDNYFQRIEFMHFCLRQSEIFILQT